MAAEESSAPDPSQDAAAGSAAAAAPDTANPCCAKLWKKYQKLERSRGALREAVQILQKENEKLQKENSNLNKACLEQRLRGDSAEAARESESAARDMLEKEVIELKAQQSSFQETQSISKDEKEALSIAQLEEEIERLKQVLGEERKRGESEKRKAEEEKKRVVEARRLLKMETSKAEEERRLADIERRTANELRTSCEKLKCEANGAREQLIAQIRKAEEAHKKVEAEKQKATREKRRADLEKSELEKLKKLMEVERKNAMEEKSRGDHLLKKLEEGRKMSDDLQINIEVEMRNAMEEKSRANRLLQKLEEEKKRNEDLKKKVDILCIGGERISSAKDGRCRLDTVVEGSNVKLLKQKLKLKKEQLKHVKNVSKLEKAKSALIRQELCCLKHDWLQLFSRLNMLDNHLADSIEGIDGSAKVNQRPEMHGMKHNLFPPNSISAPYLGLQTPSMLPFSSGCTRECTAYQLARGSCTRPTSGTSSEIEPPVGSSPRIKSSSDKSSYPRSLSDKKFVASPGKDSFFVSSLAEIGKKLDQRLSVVELSPKEGKDPQKQDKRALMEVSGYSFQGKKASKSTISGSMEAIHKVSNGSRKRNRTQKILEPAAWLRTEHNQLHLKIKEKVSELNDLLAFKDDLSYESCQEDQILVKRAFHMEDADGLRKRSYKVYGDDPANNIADRQCLAEDDFQNHKNKRQAGDITIPCLSGPIPVPFTSAGEPSAISSEFAELLSFEKMIRGDCMELLNLDDNADEERYRTAIEAPLSPHLPNIVSSSIEEPIEDDSLYLVDGTVKKFEDEGDCLVSRFDVIDLEIRSNQSELKEPPVHELTLNDNELHPSFSRHGDIDSVGHICAKSKSSAMTNISCDAKSIGEPIVFQVELEGSAHFLLDQNKVSDPGSPAAANSGCVIKQVSSGSRSSKYPEPTLPLEQLNKDIPSKSSDHEVYNTSNFALRSVVEANRTQAAEPTSTSIIGYQCGDHDGTEETPKCIVGFSNMQRSSIIRMLSYWITLICQASNASDKAGVEAAMLQKTSLEPELLPEEKVSVIFSLLLCNVCWRVIAVVDGNFALSAVSLIVKSDMETRWSFLKNIHVDYLISLIEDFLVNREVLMYGNVGCMSFPKSSECHHVDGCDIHVSSTAATIDQFISGCILLASICVEVDRMDVVLEISYKILQMGRSTLSWSLWALHAFVSVCGERFFCQNSHNFLVTAIRLVVSLLESRHKSLSMMSSCVQSTCGPAAFRPCQQCPFSLNAVSMENFISLLLDELEACCLLRVKGDNSNKCAAICDADHKFGSGGLEINCDGACTIYKYEKLPADSPDYVTGRNLCYFTEIISLLELFGSYMSWECTYNQVGIRLVKILEACKYEEYSVALFVLLGHLGRFVIDDCGYDNRAVADLKSKLSVLIETNITNLGSLPLQFAAIGALLNLLPLTFHQITDMHSGLLADPSLLHANQIQKWFVQLSSEQQSLSCSFFS